MTACEDVRLSLGAYVVGSLDGAERADVERHLDQCGACRDELSELAALPGLLARVDVAAFDPQPPSPPELLDRLLAAAATERKRARRSRVLAAAAVVAVASAIAAATAAQVADGHRSSTPAVVAAPLRMTDPVTGVSAQITPQAKNWGTAVRVRLSGVPEGEICSLVVVSRTGQREVAATWKVSYSGSVDVQGASAWSPSDIASYEVVTVDGQRLVSVDV